MITTPEPPAPPRLALLPSPFAPPPPPPPVLAVPAVPAGLGGPEKAPPPNGGTEADAEAGAERIRR